MPDDGDFQGYEHARRDLPAFKTPGLSWLGARTFRPLLGGFVAIAITAAFLAIRGGDPEVVDELTGQKLGGWSRHEDVHLLIVFNGAIFVGIAVAFLAEYTRHWVELWTALLMGGIFLAVRELSDTGQTAADILLGFTIFCAALGLAIMLADAALTRKRTGY